MKDIAACTGYSVNTVSHALNGKPDIPPHTREYIVTTAKEMGYIGNTLAGSLRSGFTKTVAIIISDISNPFFAVMVKLLEAELRQSKYSTLIMNTDEDAALEKEHVMSAISKNVDGVIICPTQQNDEAIHLLKQNHIPFVLMGRCFEGHKFESVLGDDFLCGYLAADHLLRLGHRRILFLNAPSYISSSQERQNGYKKALQDAGVEFDPALVRTVDIVSHDAESLLSGLLHQGAEFSAIFTFSDLLAWETMYVLNANGYSVPKDFSLVSIDNLQSHIRYPFPLTSVDVSKEQMASLIVTSLYRLINDGFSATVKQVLKPKLIIRQSTLPFVN